MLGSYKAGKLEGLKAGELPGFLASQPSSDELFGLTPETILIMTIITFL
jgi:hypothetical protein